jgi:hypothetical protein
MLNFVENLMNDQDLTKTDLIEGLSHFLTNFLQNLASCQTSLSLTFKREYVYFFLQHLTRLKRQFLHLWECFEGVVFIINTYIFCF